MAQVFLKLLTPKYVFTSMHKNSCFWKFFGSECVNKSRKLRKTPEKYFYATLSSVRVKLREEKSFLVRSEMLGLLLNTLTPSYEESSSNRDNLELPVHMEVCKKLQKFFRIFIAFFESALNFGHFENKNEPHGSSISDVIDSQKRIYLHAQKFSFVKTLCQ